MMYPIYQVDAFASKVFGGNPAAVVIVDTYPDDAMLQAIAAENNLSETAYLLAKGHDRYDLRWFTPKAEVALCGHATLAAAHVAWEELGHAAKTLVFDTKSGPLIVNKLSAGYLLDVPSDHPRKIPMPSAIHTMLGTQISAVYQGRDDLLCVAADQAAVSAARPDYRAIAELDTRGVVLTSRATDTDICCRCFYPALGINEDPVTGSAHAALTALWTFELRQNVLTSEQLSLRGGHLTCIYKGDRIAILGDAVTYLRGQIELP